MKCNLVEVAKAHPLYGRRLPFGQRGDKLHSRRLLLQDAERQRAQHGVALVDEGLGGGASVDRDHLTACGTEILCCVKPMRTRDACAIHRRSLASSGVRTGGRVSDLPHCRVQLDVQAFGQSHGHARVAVPDCQVTAGELKVVILRENGSAFSC